MKAFPVLNSSRPGPAGAAGRWGVRTCAAPRRASPTARKGSGCGRWARPVVELMGTVLALLDQLVASAREHPEGNLIGDLIRAADASESPLSDADLRDQLMLIIIAGTGTTVHAIGALLVHLLSHPEQLALVTSGQVSVDAALTESLCLRR